MEGFKLGFKIVAREDVKIIKTYMTCVVDNHNKFYEVSKMEHQGKYMCKIHYGRIGTNGESKKHAFDFESDRDVFFNKKIQEKLKKGYKIINKSKK